MKLEINFNDLDNLLKRIKAKESSVILSGDIDEFISKLHSDEGKEIKSFDEVELDDDGLLTMHGERIVVYIYDSKKSVEHLLQSSMVEKYPKFHIHGRCKTLLDMQHKGRYDLRYIAKAKPDGLFNIEAEEGGTTLNSGRTFGGRTVKLTKIPLAICMNCLKELGIKHEKSNQEWADSFNIKEFFKSCGPVSKPKKPPYTEHTYPPLEKKYDSEFD